MKEYFYLNGKDQHGPFTVEQLASKNLTNDTLIWTEGIEDWQNLSNFPELIRVSKTKSVPPPPPDEHQKISNQEVLRKLSGNMANIPNTGLKVIQPSQTNLTWFIVWCSFHLFALLMSTSEVENFNNNGNPRKDEFWPFVDFVNDHASFTLDQNGQYDEYLGKVGRWNSEFNGFFIEYDITEFAFYIGGAIVLFLLIRMSSSNKLKPNDHG